MWSVYGLQNIKHKHAGDLCLVALKVFSVYVLQWLHSHSICFYDFQSVRSGNVVVYIIDKGKIPQKLISRKKDTIL